MPWPTWINLQYYVHLLAINLVAPAKLLISLELPIINVKKHPDEQLLQTTQID